MFGHGVVRVAVLKTLELIGITIAIIAIGAICYKQAQKMKDPVPPPFDTKVVDLMPMGTCWVYAKTPKYDAVFVISSGDCVEAMAATGQILETRVLRDEKTGD